MEDDFNCIGLGIDDLEDDNVDAFSFDGTSGPCVDEDFDDLE